MKSPALTRSSGFVSTAATLPNPSTTSNIVATDATNGKTFKFTADANFTLSNPTGLTSEDDMAVIVWRIRQDGTGSRTITFDTKFRFGTDIPSVTLTTTLNKSDYLAVRYHSSDDKFDVISIVKGY